MFTFNHDKYNSLFPCGEPVPHSMHCDGGYPPHRPIYTKTEDIEYTKGLLNQTIENLRKFQDRMTKEFESLCAKITNDNVYFKTAMNDAFKTFMTDVQNEINDFESNVDNTISLFQNSTEMQITEKMAEIEEKYKGVAESLNDSYESFKTTVLDSINDVLTTQNERITSIEARQRMYTFKFVKTASTNVITLTLPNNNFVRLPYEKYSYNLTASSTVAAVVKIGTWDFTYDSLTDTINVSVTLGGTFAVGTEFYGTILAYPSGYEEIETGA